MSDDRPDEDDDAEIADHMTRYRDATIRAERGDDVLVRLSSQCEDARGDLTPLHPADDHWVGEADTGTTQTTHAMADGGER